MRDKPALHQPRRASFPRPVEKGEEHEQGEEYKAKKEEKREEEEKEEDKKKEDATTTWLPSTTTPPPSTTTPPTTTLPTTTRPTTTPDPAKLEAHRRALAAYFDEVAAHMRDVKSLINTTELEAMRRKSRGGAEAQKQLARAMQEDVQAKMASHMQEVMANHVDPLWTQYDEDMSGTLEPEESGALVREYIEASADRMPQMITTAMSLGRKIALDIVDDIVEADSAAGAKPPEKYVSSASGEIGSDMSADVPKMTAKIKEVIKKMSEDDSVAQISDDLRGKMDKNHDGYVTGLEFHDNFVTAMGDVTQKVRTAMRNASGA